GIDLYVLFDGSASIAAVDQRKARDVVDTLATLLGPDDRMNLFMFGRDVVSLGAYQEGLEPSAALSQASVDPSATRLAYALEGVFQRLPAQSNARVLIFSDGVETGDTALSLVEEAKRKGVPLDVYPLSSRYDTEVLVESLTLPPLVAAGEPYDLRAVIISNVATPAELSLYRDGSLVVRRLVELEPGRNVIAFEGFELPEAGDGIVTSEMRVNPVGDGLLQKNAGYGLPRVEGDARGLVVAGDPAEGGDFGRLLHAAGPAV